MSNNTWNIWEYIEVYAPQELLTDDEVEDLVILEDVRQEIQKYLFG